MPEPAPPPRALLAVLVAAMLLMVVTADMVNLVLPAIRTQFGVSEAQVAWVVTGFLLVFAVGIPLYGRVADRVGLRGLFVTVLLVFAAGSLVCALAPNLAVLVAGRIVTGAGAAAIPVLAIVAVTRLLPPGRRGAGIGFIAAAGGVGTAAGPAVGGGLGQLLGWPGLFWITLVGALALVPAALRVLPAGLAGRAEPVDVAGGVFLGLAAGLLLFGVTQSQVAGFGSPSTWGVLLGGAAATALFAWRTAAARSPFVPPSLFADRGYVAAVVAVFLTMGVNLAVLVFVPVLVVGVNGLGPGAGSLVMIPGGIAVALLSPVAGRVVDRTGPRPPVLAGLVVVGLSTLFLSCVAGASPVLAAVGALGAAAGFAFVITTVTHAAAGAVPAAQVGVGLGIFQGAQFLGAGAGPALAGALLAARQAGGADALNPLHTVAGAAGFSDAFLAMTGAVALAGVAVAALGRSGSRAAAVR